MHYRKVHLLDFKNKTKRDVSVYLFMYQFVSVSIFSYFLRVLWYVCKCGCIHKLQRTTFDSILFPLWVPVIKFSTAQAALNQLTDSTYVYVWVGVGVHTHMCMSIPLWRPDMDITSLVTFHLIHGEETSHLRPKLACLASLTNQLALGIP